MASDRDYVEQNDRERERLRALVERLSDDDLARPVNERWSVADVLGHIAFWDGRNLVLAERLEAGGSFSESDVEPEDVDWINDAAHPIIHAVPPREMAALALRLAEQTDRIVASIAPEHLFPLDPESPINPLRATHRGAHLDEIEAALAT